MELIGDIDKSGEDSKICSRSIKVGAEIGIPGIIKAHVKWVKSKITKESSNDKAVTVGDNEAATAGEYALMVQQQKVIKIAYKKMAKLQKKAEKLTAEAVGGRRTERLTCEDPESHKKK